MKKDKMLKSVLSFTFKLFMAFLVITQFSNCETEEPEEENVEEVISKVTLHFTPAGGGGTISVSAIDPDGDGPQDMAPEGDINLLMNLEYTLELEFTNDLETPPEDITEEIREEADEHMLFFGWKDGLFFNPANGNINTNRDDVRYDDEDGNGFPVGLETTWTTANMEDSGEFRVLLKHQPDLKSATSGVTTGATDVDVSFNLVIEK